MLSVLERVSALAEAADKPYFILVAGLSCSGKTTLARRLREDMSGTEALLLCQDSWFKDLPDIPRAANGYRNMESTDAFHIDEFRQAVRCAAAGESFWVPKYDVKSNRRIGAEQVQSRPLVIVEGLHTIFLLKDFLEHRYSVFVNTPVDVCCRRRVERDTALLGIDEAVVKKHFMEVIYPFYQPYIRLQEEIADLKTHNRDGEQLWN